MSFLIYDLSKQNRFGKHIFDINVIINDDVGTALAIKMIRNLSVFFHFLFFIRLFAFLCLTHSSICSEKYNI